MADQQPTDWKPTNAWQRYVVAHFGGLYHVGKLWLCIHDRGASLAWVNDMVERWRIGR